MKILFVIPYFYPKVGGLENYALHIAKGLKKQYGTSIVIVTANHLTNTNQIEDMEGIKIYRLPMWFKISNTPINPFWIFSLQKIINNEKPDIINGHTPVPFIADLAAILAFFNKIPFVLTYQNDLEKDSTLLNILFKFYYQTLGNIVLNLSNRTITTSEYYAKKSQYLQKQPQKISVVSAGVHLQNYSRDVLNKKKFEDLKNSFKQKDILLFIGQLDKTHTHKGLSYLIEAMSLVSKENKQIHLIVIGKGDYISFYKTLAQKYHVLTNITFVGFVEDMDLPYYLNVTDVLVLPSYNTSEGFGLVLLEAGASKKPVIASNVGGIPFVVQDNKTGILTRPKDAKNLYEAIMKLTTDKKLAKEMGENNYKRVKDTFLWDEQVTKTYTIFKRILS